MSLLALKAAKARHQKELERAYPATLAIGGTNYTAALATSSEPMMTGEGGIKQQRKAVFSVRTEILPLTVVRDATTQALKRVQLTHVQTGIIYRLDEEWTDPHGCSRILTCIHQHD